MNYSTYKSDPSGSAGAKLVLMTACALGLMACIAERQPVRADEAHTAQIPPAQGQKAPANTAPANTAQVSTAGLDLTTSAGMAAAAARVRETARRLCTQVEDMDDLSRHENYLACVDSSVAAALQQLKPAALAALNKSQGDDKP